ncbi:M23 family metallopeptidase [Aureitalea sp. L0-47]|uniref:M23 family metallopeptidase n=1 Tax=Aureitalea sp. L0-47 TaxID=2816962 RepID=UPI00223812B1|nr:M23 family metallopeptidase [Aureitalea sp. L0-47]MCW5518292.1 M23 family metallopeptidase [Aureitalea sp. L0-47]
MKKLILLLPLLFLFLACSTDVKEDTEIEIEPVPDIIEEYGYVLNDFNVVRDTVRPGDTFGGILDAHGVTQDKIFAVATRFKDSFDVRRMVAGKPYVLLNSKDSLNQTQVFIYEKNRVDYAVVDLRDSITAFNNKKPVDYIEKSASGVITSSLYQTMADNDLSPYMSERLADIYAWTINFFAIQPGDRFRVVYTEKYINDTISAGLGEIKAAYFEHKGRPLYAFQFVGDTVNQIPDFYDEKAENLRRAFLKAPVKFSRISSRYNLKRRIKYYGYKLRPHKGTDFAANIGTPILATADGTVTKSERRGGNGNYVKIKHNSTYDTQYLHMKSRNVKVGDFVRQGDVIGWVGMTGNTGGPHVCYRFWKNGRQVDPFKEDLPTSEPLSERLQPQFFEFIAPLREKLDCISFD